jgi:hypothetical protein
MMSLGRTYFDIALAILKEERRPMTAREITELALTKFLITEPGKTPEASMSAAPGRSNGSASGHRGAPITTSIGASTYSRSATGSVGRPKGGVAWGFTGAPSEFRRLILPRIVDLPPRELASATGLSRVLRPDPRWQACSARESLGGTAALGA